MAKRLKIEKSEKKHRWKILNYAEQTLSSDMLKGAHTEIFGCGEISIDGCLGVTDYSESYIKLKLQRGSVIICGNNFDIVFFENRLITVKGKISSVEFCV